MTRCETRHAGFEMGGLPQSEARGQLPEASRRKQLCPHLHFGTVRLISDFPPPELQGNNFVLSQATKFVVICYSSCKKLIPNGRSQLYTQGAWAWSGHHGMATNCLQTPPWRNLGKSFLPCCSHDIEWELSITGLQTHWALRLWNGSWG